MKKAKRIRIEVTDRDIRLGRRRDACHCAVARAASRAFGVPMNSGIICVGLVSMNSILSGSNYSLPNKVTRFIQDLDNREAVKPISFYLHT